MKTWEIGVLRKKLFLVTRNLQPRFPFPQQIALLPIIQTSNKFELVLDPFMGSGTVGRVCDEVNREFVGYDLKRYY